MTAKPRLLPDGDHGNSNHREHRAHGDNEPADLEVFKSWNPDLHLRDPITGQFIDMYGVYGTDSDEQEPAWRLWNNNGT